MLAVRRAASASIRAAVAGSSRTFFVAATVRKDFVQDLYLRELKGYKPKEVSANAHVGNVKEFHSPAAPKAPAVPSAADLAKELDAYEKEDVPTGATSASSSASEADDAAPGQTADEYLAFIEQEAKHVPAAEHH